MVCGCIARCSFRRLQFHLRIQQSRIAELWTNGKQAYIAIIGERAGRREATSFLSLSLSLSLVRSPFGLLTGSNTCGHGAARFPAKSHDRAAKGHTLSRSLKNSGVAPRHSRTGRSANYENYVSVKGKVLSSLSRSRETRWRTIGGEERELASSTRFQPVCVRSGWRSSPFPLGKSIDEGRR